MKRTLGTCYYPEHWPRATWEEDARRMAGLTSVVAEGRAEAPVATAALFADPPEALRSYLG